MPHTEQTSQHELQFRLDHADRYLRTKYGESGAAAISTLLAPALREEASVGAYPAGTAEDYEDIDGVPLDIAALTPLERMLAQQIEGSGNTGPGPAPGGYDDDDIDGCRSIWLSILFLYPAIPGIARHCTSCKLEIGCNRTVFSPP